MSGFGLLYLVYLCLGFGLPLLPVEAPVSENVNKIPPVIFQYDKGLSTIFHCLKPFN